MSRSVARGEDRLGGVPPFRRRRPGPVSRLGTSGRGIPVVQNPPDPPQRVVGLIDDGVHRAMPFVALDGCRRSAWTSLRHLSDVGLVPGTPYLTAWTSSGDTIPNCLGEFREIRESNERTSVAA